MSPDGTVALVDRAGGRLVSDVVGLVLRVLLDELLPSALHTVEQYANNPIEADPGRLKARLRPMRGLKRHRSARILATGHAFMQKNLRRGHYDIATVEHDHCRFRKAFDDLALTT
jgi:transposase, IS6 family